MRPVYDAGAVRTLRRAIRVVGLKDVRYAARDTAAGNLALLDATDFMRRSEVQVQHPERPDLEAVLIAMNVAAQIPITREPRKKVSPTSIVRTEEIMGFRT